MQRAGLPYSVAGRRLPSLLAWALETGLWTEPAHDGVGTLLADFKRNNLALYGYEHIVGASDQLVHDDDRPEHLARALGSPSDEDATWEPDAAVLIGRNSYDAPLLLEYSRPGPTPRILYLRETDDRQRRWTLLGRPDQLFGALWPDKAGPPGDWTPSGPSPRRWSVRGFALPPALSRMLCTGRWRAPKLLEVLTLEAIYARAIELDRDRELRDLLTVARVADSEICLDYAEVDRESSDAQPSVVMYTPGLEPRTIADDFATWAAGYWPEDASDAAREAKLFASDEVPLRTAPQLWMPGVDPD